MGSFDKLKISGCDYLLDSSGSMIFHVNSYHALMQAVGYLKYTAQPWERIYLRGQSELYKDLKPSLYRGIKKNQDKEIGTKIYQVQ